MIMGIIKLNVKCFSTAGIQQKMFFTFIIQYCFAEKPKGLSLSEREHKDLENLPPLYDLLPQRF
jgi:hypothetical protein